MEIPTTVTEKSTPQDLRNAGDFAYSNVQTAFHGLQKSVVMKCPFCQGSISMPLTRSFAKRFITIFYRLLNRPGELLTFDKPIVCSICTTQFKIWHGKIEKLEN